MITTTGREVWPERGCPSLYDIGYGLSRIPRFVGQTVYPYSVLKHSFVCMQLVDQEIKAYALLHDAAEAIRGDIPTSWKISADRGVESTLMRRIYREAGLLVPSKAIKKAVKLADTQALMAEAHVCEAFSPEDRWPMCDIDPEAIELTRMYLNDPRFEDPSFAGITFDRSVQALLKSTGRVRA